MSCDRKELIPGQEYLLPLKDGGAYASASMEAEKVRVSPPHRAIQHTTSRHDWLGPLQAPGAAGSRSSWSARVLPLYCALCALSRFVRFR